METLKPCPYCGSTNLKDCYVFIKCEKCLMNGPKMNGGNNDAHSDFIDHENAIKAWNKLPRKHKNKKRSKYETLKSKSSLLFYQLGPLS